MATTWINACSRDQRWQGMGAPSLGLSSDWLVGGGELVFFDGGMQSFKLIFLSCDQSERSYNGLTSACTLPWLAQNRRGSLGEFVDQILPKIL